MPILTPISSSGHKVRTPGWWLKFVDLIPKIYISALEPKTWTKELAEKWVNSIPSKCPFERQLWYKDILVLYVPALCPLNPLSSQLYSIRLKAQAYLSILSEE